MADGAVSGEGDVGEFFVGVVCECPFGPHFEDESEVVLERSGDVATFAGEDVGFGFGEVLAAGERVLGRSYGSSIPDWS